MIQRILFLFFIVAFNLDLDAQQIVAPPKDGWSNTRKGNESFKKNDFATAEKYYQEGAEKDTNHATANYNLGNALYRQKKYDEAEKAYANATASTNADSASRSWHNLGNSMLQQNKLQESINAYKEALKLNPNDEQTRYNLAYAQSKLKAQQPPPKQNQNNQNKNQQQKPQPQKNQQQKQNQQNQDKQSSKDQQQNPSMSKDEAQRMLDALKDQEKKTRDKINGRKNKSGYNKSKDKDW